MFLNLISLHIIFFIKKHMQKSLGIVGIDLQDELFAL